MQVMQSIALPNSTDYHDLYTLSGLASGTSLIVTNNTPQTIKIFQDGTLPSGSDGFPVWPGHTVLVHGNNIASCWVKGLTQGFIIVQELTSTVTPFTGVEFAQDIVTSGKEGFRRLQVDQAQTGFFEGREFRIVRKIRMSTVGQKYCIKIQAGLDFILHQQNYSVSSGGYELHVYRAGANVSEATPFNTPIPIFNKNISSEYRDYNGDRFLTQGVISEGGSLNVVDPELFADYQELRTSGATAQRTTVTGENSNTNRYLAAGTYYLEFTAIEVPVRGIVNIAWEERPIDVK